MEDPFEQAGREFRRAMEQHARLMREEMDRAREEMRKAMDRARAEMEKAKAEFEKMMEQAREQMGGATGTDQRQDFESWLRASMKAAPAHRSKRPRRKPPGGEPAPVKPRPKPKPLVDGAEAPID